MVEAASSHQNKLRRSFLHLVDMHGNGDGLGGFYIAASGVSFEASDLGGEYFCPSLGFFDSSAGVGGFSDEALGRSWPSSFLVACVGGEWDLVVAGMCMVLGGGSFCRGFGTDGYVLVVFLCVGDRLLWMILCAIGSHDINGDADLASFGMVWRSSGVFSFQLDEKPGWILVPTFFGGSAPLRGSSSSGELGALALVVSDPSVSDDVMF